MTIVDYFNPRNINHMKAFDELLKTNDFPEGFGDGYDYPHDWHQQLKDKVVLTWTHHCMESGGMKAKLHQAKIRLMNLGDHRPEVETAIAVMEESGRLLP